MPDNRPEAKPFYAHYLEQYSKLDTQVLALEKELEYLQYEPLEPGEKVPAYMYTSSPCPRGFSAHAMYFSEAHWLQLINKQLHRIDQLKAQVRMYADENVANLKAHALRSGVKLYEAPE